jgi:hypothetical protein
MFEKHLDKLLRFYPLCNGRGHVAYAKHITQYLQSHPNPSVTLLGECSSLLIPLTILTARFISLEILIQQYIGGVNRILRLGDVSADIRANIVVHAITALRLVSQDILVSSFEPSTSDRKLVDCSCDTNKLASVSAFGQALSSKVGEINLCKSPNNTGSEHVT